MPTSRHASLQRRFPRRIDIPLLLSVGALLVLLGLLIPAVETQTLFWRTEYSILLNLRQMSKDGRHAGAAIIALCSVVYPAAKFSLLMAFWLFPFPARWRSRSIRIIRALGRWSMVDVLTIVSIVLASMTIGPLEATPRMGLFCYAAGMLCLMIAALLMDRLTRGRR